MKKAEVFQSALLAAVDHLVHGYSSRFDGDMQNPTMRARFAVSLGLDGTTLSKPEQVHGNKVAFVHEIDTDSIIQDVDGLVSNGRSLCVITADCVPMLAVDPKTRVLGAAHAGWQGTIDDIATNLITKMLEHGAVREEILIAIGPRIGLSCYDVPFERAELFRKKYGARDIVKKLGDTWHIDIGKANVRALRRAGIPKHNIDVLPVCTSCNIDSFYSYRKDSQKSYGEMVGIIGWKN